MTQQIRLTQGMVALVDDEDYPRLAKYRWQAMQVWPGRWYAGRQENSTTIYMHREFASPADGQLTHHDNGDSLDNTRKNLIPSTLVDHAKLHRLGRIHNPNKAVRSNKKRILRTAGLTLLNIARLLLIRKQTAQMTCGDDRIFNLCGAARELGLSRQRVQQIALHRVIGIHESYYWKFSWQDIALMRALRGFRFRETSHRLRNLKVNSCSKR